ncbi:MAG: aspartate-semialdehyde dehydrogenase [Oligoflexia bacterium]|nr:aspartate-semialdehyde dehydrogenase [Oligoflexia bacterium]
MKKAVNVSVVGATGLVGQEFLNILEDRKFPVGEIRLFASDQSIGEEILFNGKRHSAKGLEPGCFKGTDVAFFSAGGTVSEQWAPIAVKEGAFVVDNSSAFRMDRNVPLVVPEVNAHRIPVGKPPQIIANPNCSTIQMVVALKPLLDSFGIQSVIVSTYQSVSGAGKLGVEELSRQTIAMLNGQEPKEPETFAHPIAFNNLPHIDRFDSSGFTYEELKIIRETRKILEVDDLDVSATAVRTPTFNGHSEAVWVTLNKAVDKSEIIKAFQKIKGLTIQDDPQSNLYPLNREASGKDDVFVGRIRQDLFNPRRYVFWVVSDNVRKGAALNGVQIAEKLFGLH